MMNSCGTEWNDYPLPRKTYVFEVANPTAPALVIVQADNEHLARSLAAIQYVQCFGPVLVPVEYKLVEALSVHTTCALAVMLNEVKWNDERE